MLSAMDSRPTNGSPTPSRDGGGAADDAYGDVVYDVFAVRCTSREALGHITGRWGILALGALSEGTYRFNALRRRVDGVSEKMLAQTLQALERDGFVLRKAEPTIPPRVEYSLTPLGREAAERLWDVIKWLEARMPEVTAAQARYDEERSAG
ncbi:helix-turn-helix domain-containing protein [Actinoallomurus spadix]|uniref:Helix-turn-helix domain-containing protein n=2 Tax=Actinoallomurus spadix TaxID=79912 RepID=A0ABP3GRI0_9ACTN